MKLTRLCAILATAACIASPALAADAPLPEVLRSATQGGLTVVKSFPAEGGLTGHILSEGPGKNIVVYTPPSGDVVISGAMVNARGVNLTQQYLDQHAPKIDYGSFAARLEKSSFVREGASDKAAKSVVYVFKDANCSFCHLAREAYAAYYPVGLQVRWIPVAFLGRDSANKAAALMTAPDQASVLKQMHEEFGKQSSFSNTPVSADVSRKLDDNAKLMQDMGFRGTPAMLYKGKDGKWAALDGMPRLSQLPAAFGLPEQPHTNPALARFR